MKKLDQIIIELKKDVKSNGLTLNEKEENFIKTLFALVSKEKNIKNLNLRINSYLNNINSMINNSNQSEEFNKAINTEKLSTEFTKEEKENIINVLIKTEYLNKLYVFENDDYDCYFYDNDEDIEYIEEIKEELVKSIEALKKSENESYKYSETYKQNCGKITNPWTGSEEHDPLDVIVVNYLWTDKLKSSIEFVTYSEDDELEALRTLIPENLKDDVKKLALHFAQERFLKD